MACVGPMQKFWIGSSNQVPTSMGGRVQRGVGWGGGGGRCLSGGLWALGYPSRTEEGLTGPRVAPLGKLGAGTPHTPPAMRPAGGAHASYLIGGGRGGGGPGEGGRGSKGGSPPRAGMNHIDQELQKCTTVTHSGYTFVIMSEHR